MKRILHLAVILSLLQLSACSSGNSDSNQNTSDDSSNNTLHVSEVGQPPALHSVPPPSLENVGGENKFSVLSTGSALKVQASGNSLLANFNENKNATAVHVNKELVHFNAKDGTDLIGYIYKPDGDGPFPTILWNHGSGVSASTGHVATPEEYDVTTLEYATPFVEKGYAVFAPFRRGQGGSKGEYIEDVLGKISDKQERGQKFVELMSGSQLQDQLSGLAFIKNKPFVDKNNLFVMGCSFGGTQTLLAAAQDPKETNFKAAVALSPDAESWNSQPMQDYLKGTIAPGVKIPVFIIHPAKDASLEPGYTLGKILQDLGKPYSLMIFPPFGSERSQGHCFGGGDGADIWAPYAMKFFARSDDYKKNASDSDEGKKDDDVEYPKMIQRLADKMGLSEEEFAKQLLNSEKYKPALLGYAGSDGKLGPKEMKKVVENGLFPPKDKPDRDLVSFLANHDTKLSDALDKSKTSDNVVFYLNMVQADERLIHLLRIMYDGVTMEPPPEGYGGHSNWWDATLINWDNKLFEPFTSGFSKDYCNPLALGSPRPESRGKVNDKLWPDEAPKCFPF